MEFTAGYSIPYPAADIRAVYGSDAVEYRVQDYRSDRTDNVSILAYT